MTKTKSVQGTRKVVTGKWVTVTTDTLGVRKNFKVFTESRNDCISYLIYKLASNNDVYTHILKIDGQWISREEVEKTLKNLHDYEGLSKALLQLFAVNNMFTHLY